DRCVSGHRTDGSASRGVGQTHISGRSRRRAPVAGRWVIVGGAGAPRLLRYHRTAPPTLPQVRDPRRTTAGKSLPRRLLLCRRGAPNRGVEVRLRWNSERKRSAAGVAGQTLPMVVLFLVVLCGMA